VLASCCGLHAEVLAADPDEGARSQGLLVQFPLVLAADREAAAQAHEAPALCRHVPAHSGAAELQAQARRQRGGARRLGGRGRGRCGRRGPS